MSDKDQKIIGEGTVLRGNFVPRESNDPGLSAEETKKSDARLRTEEFEKAARERIGGSISFITRLKDEKTNPLAWDGED